MARVGFPNFMINLPSFFAMMAKHMINMIYFVQVWDGTKYGVTASMSSSPSVIAEAMWEAISLTGRQLPACSFKSMAWRRVGPLKA